MSESYEPQKKKCPLVWETVNEYGNYLGGSWTERTKVFGGWVLQQTYLRNPPTDNSSYSLATSSVFIPDPNHEWVL